MKLISYKQNGNIKFGALEEGKIYDLNAIDSQIADNMLEFLQGGKEQLQLAKTAVENGSPTIFAEDVSLISPVPNPPSVRDAYAFRQHVATARRNRGLEMIPEFDEIPIFYFTNHHAVFGEGDFPVRQRHTEKLDFELECAAVIGRGGRNISTGDADDYIAGFMIMNDLSARVLQIAGNEAESSSTILVDEEVKAPSKVDSPTPNLIPLQSPNPKPAADASTAGPIE